jgi:hypothetical protein
MTNALTERIIVNQRHPCPVDADRTKEAMLHGIPLGRASRIMNYPGCEGPSCWRSLETALPIMRLCSVGAPRVCEDQQLRCGGVQSSTNTTPPRMDGVCSEGRGVVRRPDDDKAVATRHIVVAVGIATPSASLGKSYISTSTGLAPLATLILEQPDQLSLLGINADDGLVALRERALEPVDIRELPVPIRRRSPSQSLSIESDSVLGYAEHSPSLGMAHPKGTRQCTRRLPCPFHRRHRISGSRAVHRAVHALDQVSPFFFERFPAAARPAHPTWRHKVDTHKLSLALRDGRATLLLQR